MKVNGKKINGNKFAYDECHKIYILEDEQDVDEALKYGYRIYPISSLQEKFEDSCGLQFIQNWKLDKRYVDQFVEARFEED
jgi:hypothetical protein